MTVRRLSPWKLAVTIALVGASSFARASAQVSGAAQPIVNGHLTAAADAYGTVALIDIAFGQFYCTGVLITPRVVVTAAHCIDVGTRTLPPSEIAVAYGVLDVTVMPSNDHLVGVTSAVAHPGYATNPAGDELGTGLDPTAADIGVLVLARDLVGITPVALATHAESELATSTGEVLTLSGFGDTQTPSPVGVLMSTDSTVEASVAREFLAAPTSTAQGDSCFGDSGGPAYAFIDGEVRLVGITSRGREDAAVDCGAGGIWTKPSEYRAWLRHTSGDARVAPELARSGGCTLVGTDAPKAQSAPSYAGISCLLALAGARRIRRGRPQPARPLRTSRTIA